jgi:hypothetical protein
MRAWRARSLLWLSVALSLASCARTANYTRTGKAFQARPDDCEFEVYLRTPPGRITEIGIVTFSALGGGAEGRARSVSEAKERAAQHVCKEGGNALVVQSDGAGAFVRGTVVLVASE